MHSAPSRKLWGLSCLDHLQPLGWGGGGASYLPLVFILPSSFWELNISEGLTALPSGKPEGSWDHVTPPRQKAFLTHSEMDAVDEPLQKHDIRHLLPLVTVPPVDLLMFLLAKVVAEVEHHIKRRRAMFKWTNRPPPLLLLTGGPGPELPFNREKP